MQRKAFVNEVRSENFASGELVVTTQNSTRRPFGTWRKILRLVSFHALTRLVRLIAAPSAPLFPGIFLAFIPQLTQCYQTKHTVILRLVSPLPPSLAPIAAVIFTAKMDVPNTYARSTAQIDLSLVRRRRRPHHHPHHIPRLLLNRTMNRLNSRSLCMEDLMPILIKMRCLVFIFRLIKNRTKAHHLRMVQGTCVFVTVHRHMLPVSIILGSMVSQVF